MIKNVVSIKLPVAEEMIISKMRLLPPGVTEDEAKELPRFVVATGTHGDELEGQYVCYLLNQAIAAHPEYLKSMIDIYPAINPLGIDSISRGIPHFDLDMNRIFPGNSQGTTEEVIAARIIEDMAGAVCAVDIHASNIFLREIPQVRINVNTAEKLVPLAKCLNCDFIWIHSAVTVLESTLAYSLNSIGTPCLVIEAGVGMRITKAFGERITSGLLNLMHELDLWTGPVEQTTDPIVSADGKVGFVNANTSGVFIPQTEHWHSICAGESLGKIINPGTGQTLEDVLSPVTGRIFTLREFPIVNPGSLVARILELKSE